MNIRKQDSVLTRAREFGRATYRWARVGRPFRQRFTRRRIVSQGVKMAKALYGHVGAAPDRRLLDEVTRLRSRVQSLEFEITRLRAENDRLAAAAAETDDLLRLPEPALT